jgi:hypothetical protein
LVFSFYGFLVVFECRGWFFAAGSCCGGLSTGFIQTTAVLLLPEILKDMRLYFVHLF